VHIGTVSAAASRPDFSPELQLIIACCRWPDDRVRRNAIKAAARGVGDWKEVAALASAHRVEGLVAQGMTSAKVRLPAEFDDFCRITATQVRSGVLMQLNETLRIADALDRAAIGYRFLKGIVLGAAIYGTPTLKHSWDIDLLVAPENAVAAAAVLQGLGYAAVKPRRPLTTAEFRRWSVVAKDAELRSVNGVAVELHWRLSDLPYVLTDIDVHTEARLVPVMGDRSVPTFADAPNLAYLAAHGAAAGWSRLKWVADFAALLAGYDEASRDGLIQSARQYRTGLALDQALALHDRLFATSLSSGAVQSSDVNRLVDDALVAIARRSTEEPISGDKAVMRSIRRSRWMLMPGWRYRAALALTRLRGLEDREAVALPAGLHWAYGLMRPVTYGLRSGKRLLARSVGRWPHRVPDVLK
jgi:hypothetical protein